MVVLGIRCGLTPDSDQRFSRWLGMHERCLEGTVSVSGVLRAVREQIFVGHPMSGRNVVNNVANRLRQVMP